MSTIRLTVLTSVLAVSLVSSAFPQAIPAPPGTAIPAALFEMHQLDFHLHSGMEREVDLNSWLEMAAAGDRRFGDRPSL